MMARQKPSILLPILVTLTIFAGARADWFIVENPATGSPESVWSTLPPGQSHTEVYYSSLNGSSWAPSTALTSNGYDDSNPVLAFDSDGGRTVAWETGESVPRILMRTLSASGGAWSDALVVSDSSESSRSPGVVVVAGQTYVSYETASSGGGRTVKIAKQDTTGSWDRTAAATSASGAMLQPRIHSENGHLWVDWVDSASTIGFSECVDGVWGSVGQESITGAADIAAGRSRVRSLVLGL